MFTNQRFWASALEGSIRAAAAAALAVIGTDQLISALGIDWTQVVGVAILAGAIALLTSIAVPDHEIREERRELRLAAEKAAAKPKPGVKNAKPKATKKA
jgi:4'-phosphopantetheinyl transferase EntD